MVPIPYDKFRLVKDVIIPYFIIHYMIVDKDLWRPLTQDDYDLLADLWLQTFQEPVGYKITGYTDIGKHVCSIALSP